jgi:hypothetical protein
VATVLDLLGDPVPLPDDLLDGEAADNRPEVAGEHPADEHLHPVLLGQEPAGRVRDRRLVVADLERGDRPDVQPDALVGDAFLDDLRLAQGSESTRAFCFTGVTKQPCPVTMRNCVASLCRFEPEISRASFGAGTCQKT